MKAFIRSFGTLGKTDAIDARALAFYGQEREERLGRWQAPDEQRDQLQALVLTKRPLWLGWRRIPSKAARMMPSGAPEAAGRRLKA